MVVIGFIVVGIIGTLLRGVVFQQLWGWFVADTFHIQTLGLVEAIGLAFIVGFFGLPIRLFDQGQ